MKTIVWQIHFGDEFKRGIHLSFALSTASDFSFHGNKCVGSPKGSAPLPEKAMPVSAGKTQMIFQLLPRDQFVFIIPAKCKRIIGARSFKFYLRNIFEKFPIP
jgi:hypothetical protein